MHYHVISEHPRSYRRTVLKSGGFDVARGRAVERQKVTFQYRPPEPNTASGRLDFWSRIAVSRLVRVAVWKRRGNHNGGRLDLEIKIAVITASVLGIGT